MRLALCLTLAAGLLTYLRADDLKPITAAAAIDQVGKPKILVELTVRSAKDRLEKRGIIYLDSEDDFTDPNNLGIAISAEAAAKFKDMGILEPASHFKGKTIRVRGCVMRFESRPYLPVHDPKQIFIVERE